MLSVAFDSYLSSIKTLHITKKHIRELEDDVKSLLVLCEKETDKEEDKVATSNGERF